MTDSQRESALALVRKFITTLECSAVDVRHSPAMYARFLRRILGEPTEVTAGDHSEQRTASRVTNNAQSVSVAQNSDSNTAFLSTVNASARVAFSPGPSEPGPEEDVLAAMYSLTGDFWDNALLPGTWGISSTPRW
jgi:hypothetical protein